MGKLGGVFICLLVVALDVTAGILGIEAEDAQNKVRHVKLFIFECKEPSHQAYKLALSAAVLLAVAHAISHLLGGCICICSSDELGRSSTSRKLAAGALVFSWIVAIVAFSMLLIGAMANSKSESKCGLKHGHVLSWGGILCFAHGILSVVYYVCAISGRNEAKAPPA